MNSYAGRVLMLLENCPYPQDSRVSQEARALASAGFLVSVICPSNLDQPWRETLDGVDVYRYPAPPAANGFFSYAWEYGYSLLASFVLSLFVFVRKGFDTVHAHNPPDAFVFIAAVYKLLGRRFVYDQHDLAPEMYCARFEGRSNRLIHQTLVLLENLSYRLADHVLTTNQSYKLVAMQRGHVPEQRITIVRNGPDMNRLWVVESHQGLQGRGKTVIGYLGTIGFQDGVDHLLKALHDLRYILERTDFVCVLAGTGVALPSLRSLAAQLGLVEHTLFVGWVEANEVSRFLSAAEICVAPEPSNPYNDRSTMIKIMEYMAVGKPIVAFDLPEHRFTAQRAALYVRPNDSTEMARALAELMDDPARRKRMGLFGRRRVETALAWSYSIPNLLQVYRALRPNDPREQARRGATAAIESQTCGRGHLGSACGVSDTGIFQK